MTGTKPKRRIWALLLLAAGGAAGLATYGGDILPAYLDESRPVEERIEDALSRMTLDEKIAMCHAQSKFSTPGCPRLGIPEIWMSDGPHGVRMEFTWDEWQHAGWTNDSCTAMPSLTCLAATFNPDLAFGYGNVVGEEARFRKKDIILGPGVNIYRTPLSGRNFEYMGEDPYLASRMVKPYIHGVQRNGVSACLKHFALNNQEKDRSEINVEVGERALNEIYLPAFKAGVDAGVWSVMGSYNRYKGDFCSHNDTLVNRILKGDWGFDGVLVTDWGSAHDTRQAAENGLDIEMGSWTNGLTWGLSSAYDSYFMAEPLKQMIKAGEVSEELLDDKIRRILRLGFRTNMDRQRPLGSLNTGEHLDVARRVADEGIVLLKNDDSFFPIEEGFRGTIAVIGENAVRKLSIGGGSSELKPKVELTPLETLGAVYGDAIRYGMGYSSGEPDYSRALPAPFDADSLRIAAVNLAKEADRVIFIGGLNKNYKQDCEGEDRDSFSLPFDQDRLISELAEANGNIAVVLVGGNAVDMPWEAEVKSIVCSWYPGSVGAASLADIICGRVNPSGKLPFTIARRLEDYPAHNGDPRCYPGVDGTVHYDEGILVGYRWADTKEVAPRYAFGHGLSYTRFDYSGLKTDKKAYSPGDVIRVSLNVANAGERDGAETVQFYVTQCNPAVERPAKELKGFCKNFIRKDESSHYEVEIPVESLGYFDETEHCFRVDTDDYVIYAASASDDIREKINIRIEN